MKKKHTLNFFTKTLLISLAMLLSIVLIAYLLLYLLMPRFYREYKKKEYTGMAGKFASELSLAKDESEEFSLLTDFAHQNHIGCAILDKDGKTLVRFSENLGVSLEQNTDSDAISTEHENTSILSYSVSENAGKNDSLQAECDYQNASGMPRTLILDVPLQPINEAKTVLFQVLPFACLFCVLFSFLLATIFSHIVTQPIRKVQKSVREMAELQPDARISDSDGGAFAEMSADINAMYEELRTTIVDLEKQIRMHDDSENQKIAFLRNVSHELKTPLASANALIEGITCGIPPYCEEKEKYLKECQTLLSRAITLTKESLNLSPVYHEEPKEMDLKTMVEKEFRQYKVILKSRQIRTSLDVPENYFIRTSPNLFSQVLSNVFSNAAKYTNAGGSVNVRFSENTLMIENTCTPLSEEEIKDAMKPLHTGKAPHPDSNGLGLFIVSQSLGLLKLPFEFAPIPDGSGMRFSITVTGPSVISDQEALTSH